VAGGFGFRLQQSCLVLPCRELLCRELVVDLLTLSIDLLAFTIGFLLALSIGFLLGISVGRISGLVFGRWSAGRRTRVDPGVGVGLVADGRPSLARCCVRPAGLCRRAGGAGSTCSGCSPAPLGAIRRSSRQLA
jgi:hypothetical protein